MDCLSFYCIYLQKMGYIFIPLAFSVLIILDWFSRICHFIKVLIFKLYNFYVAWRTGEGICSDTLSRRFHTRRFSYENQSNGSKSSGKYFPRQNSILTLRQRYFFMLRCSSGLNVLFFSILLLFMNYLEQNLKLQFDCFYFICLITTLCIL